jgi:hypothetical protein
VTNYCQNKLAIEGPHAELAAFAQDCLSLHDDLHLLDLRKFSQCRLSSKAFIAASHPNLEVRLRAGYRPV